MGVVPHTTCPKPLRGGGFGACRLLGGPIGRTGSLIIGAAGPGRCAPESWGCGYPMEMRVPPLSVVGDMSVATWGLPPVRPHMCEGLGGGARFRALQAQSAMRPGLGF